MFHNWGVPDLQSLSSLPRPSHVVWVQKKVATLAGAELITVTNTLESNEHQIKVASDWSIAMDLTLTELKVGNRFCCGLCFVFLFFW